jgi:hypothetical protein
MMDDNILAVILDHSMPDDLPCAHRFHPEQETENGELHLLVWLS